MNFVWRNRLQPAFVKDSDTGWKSHALRHRGMNREGNGRRGQRVFVSTPHRRVPAPSRSGWAKNKVAECLQAIVPNSISRVHLGGSAETCGRRSEERRVGTGRVLTCSSRGWAEP